jgi:hypothetical protein
MSQEDSEPESARSDPEARRFGVDRRTFLTALGATAVAGGLSSPAAAAPPYVVQQGDSAREITPLSGEQPVEDLLNYQLPDGEYDGANGARDDGGPYFAITGAETLQRDNTSVLFLYDGPNGLSLVVLHGHTGSSGSAGGAVSFSLSGMPADGEWVVKDDRYLDPDTGEPASTNYDVWNVDGTNHTIDWTYGDSRTDGGAFRDLSDSFAITIDPAFNEDAALYGQYYEGDLTDWEVLSGDIADPERAGLDMDRPVTIGSSDQLGPQPTYTVSQGETSVEVTPLSGEVPAEELYDLRLPERFEGDNGATDPGSGPYYQSVGTQDLQAESTTITFLYEGPDGLSLVVVHDTDGGDGGSATWSVTGLPRDGNWVVKDDRYLDPDTGEPASTNYDRWDTDGTDHTIDWTWGAGGTDGGVFRDLGDAFGLTIDPAYNEDAALWDEYYTGDVVDWQFLSGGRSDPDRTSLSLDRPMTIEAETPAPPPEPTYTLQQGDTTVELEAVQGLEPIEDRYALQIPDQFDGTASATDRGGPYYTALGLSDAQAAGETATFLYDGPNGLSLVVLHGQTDGSGGGGAATWSVAGLPQDGNWVVKDDYYLSPETGEPAPSNYDRWDTDGTDHTIDWTWAATRTDGGAFRDLGDSFTVTIDPAYNEQAALHEQFYDGDVTAWRALSGSLDDPDVTTLALDEPVTITTGDPSTTPFGVSTVGSSESESGVTFTGRLDGLGELDTATVYFKYWETGSQESTTAWWTGPERSTTGTFTTTVDLDSGTAYSVRALARGSDGTWKVGAVQEFTTASAGLTYTVVQDGTSVEVTPLSGEVPAEELYDLRLPERFEGDNGATDPGSGPYYQSVGTQDLQAESTTITFLYEGPDGLSLVVVHDTDGGDGGSATWSVTGLPRDGNWVVKDDRYLDPDTGEPASTNYDRWDTDGTDHTIDWTWGAGGTDGGVFRDLGDAFGLTIDPAYNEDAALWDEYYTGDVVDWQFLSGGRSDPDRTSLSLDRPVTILTQTEFGVSTVGSTVSGSGATLTGRLDGLGTLDSATVYFRYWETGDEDATETWWTGTSRATPGTFSTAVDLDTGTAYSVQALAQGSDGTWKVGAVQEFTTGGQQFGVRTDGATDLTEGQATLTGTLTGLGDADSATVYVEYWVADRPDSSYWWTGTARSQSGSFATTFDLRGGTTYRYRALAQTEGGRWTAGRQTEFTTPGEPFAVETDTPTDVSSDSVTLNGTLAGLGEADSATVYFTYWQVGAKESTLSWYTGASRSRPGTFSADQRLASGTYRYQALARDASGSWKAGDDVEFTVP